MKIYAIFYLALAPIKKTCRPILLSLFSLCFTLTAFADTKPVTQLISYTSKAEQILELLVKLGPSEDMGESATGYRLNYPIIGGSFFGKGLKGKIIPGGADFAVRRKDGTLDVDALYRIKTDDGSIIIIHNKGIYRPNQQGRIKQANGDPLEPKDYYGMSSPVFHTQPGHYSWLQNFIFFGTIEDPGRDDQVRIRIFRLDQPAIK